MAGIELTIAEGALAIFPGFPPLHRGEADPEPGGRSRLAVTPAAQLQHVVAAQIVMQAVDDAGHVAGKNVGFRRMKIAARGIAAHRPAVRPIFLPGREPKRKLQKFAHGFDSERNRSGGAGQASLGETRGRLASPEVKFGSRAACKFAERIGLRVPIERLGTCRIALEAVLGPRVIAEDNFSGAQDLRCGDVHGDGAGAGG